MKHISFDDSTVLREFARIANDQGFVKAASIKEEPKIIVLAADATQQSFQNFLAEVAKMPGQKKSPIYIELAQWAIPAGQDAKELSALIQERFPTTASLAAKYLVAPPTPFQKLKEQAKKISTQPNDAPGLLYKELGEIGSKNPNWKKYVYNKYKANPNLKTIMDLAFGIKVPVKSSKNNDRLESFIKSANPLVAEMKRLNLVHAKLMRGDRSLVGKEYERAVSSSVARLKKQYGEHPEIDKFRQQALLISKRQVVSSTQRDDGFIVSNAKDDSSNLYDISGETGEQLVEKAHPGGGTRTELSHSKTEENLVETIVEQQKKDLEVARAVPKGTHAALVRLHNMLNKMGHGARLGELRGIISSVTPINNHVAETLSSLSRKLYQMGYKKSSIRIDNLKQKDHLSVEAEDNYGYSAKDFIADLSRKIRKDNPEAFAYAARTAPSNRILDKVRNIQALSLLDAAEKAHQIVDEGGAVFPSGLNSFLSVFKSKKYFKQLKLEQSGKKELTIGDPVMGSGPLDASSISPGKGTDLTDRGVFRPKGRGARRWQLAYNAAIGKVAPELMINPITGKWDRKTRAAAKAVKGAGGGFRTYRNYLIKQKQQKQQIPLPPDAPPTTPGSQYPLPPASPAAPLNPNQFRPIADKLTQLLVNKYRGINIYSGEWNAVLRELKNRVRSFSSNGIDEQIKNVVDEFDINKMNSMRLRGPKGKMGR